MAESLRDATPVAVTVLEEERAPVEVSVHDASRLAWNVTVPLVAEGQAHYSFELELEVPTNLMSMIDPWSALESYGRLDETNGALEASPEAFRRSIAGLSARLARARDGFIRHCTLIQSSVAVEDNHTRALRLWLGAMSTELTRARSGVLGQMSEQSERQLADEFVSVQMWAMLTDCARSLFDLRRALDERGQPGIGILDEVETDLAKSLGDEIAYRRRADLPSADPLNTLQLERLLSRMRWLKRHFERVSVLDVESYQVAHRLGAWFSALAAMVAYLWFVSVQFALASRPHALSSGVVVLVMATALAYVSRDRLKELGRNWLAGRVQRMFAQRVTRYWVPARDQQHRPLVATARESFSQSGAQRLDPSDPGSSAAHDVTLLRLIHRGTLARTLHAGESGTQVRLLYRLDLSWLFSRLHDAVRGFASIDPRTGEIGIVDVPRNYELPIRVSVEDGGASRKMHWTLIVNKNGLVRVSEGEATARGALISSEKRRRSAVRA